ncbi:MAG: CRISPR-associated protein Cas4 [Candidatus Lokiarchaeota archaeon]|nr:CRISPR-associated protein Cas4 [Candidatus Harpocratesius repetitus]
MSKIMDDWFPLEPLNKKKNGEWFFSADELRQYFYCPRIPFYRIVRKLKTNQTAIMRRGKVFHEKIVHKRKKLEKWLKINEKNQEKNMYYFNLYLESPSLHLLAYLDLVEKEKDSNEIYPVELKTVSELPKNNIFLVKGHLIQLTVHSLLLEEHFNTFISKAKLIYISNEKVKSFWQEITIDMKKVVLKTVNKMHKSIISEDIPAPIKNLNKCRVCDFRRICKII